MLDQWFSRFSKKAKAKFNNTGIKAGSKNDDFDDLSVGFSSYTGEKITSTKIRDALLAAEEGDPIEQAALFNTILEKDPEIASHLQTRVLSILACDWNIADKKGEKNEEETEFFENRGLYDLLKHLLSALAFGYSGVVTRWKPGGADIEEFVEVNPQNFSFDLAGNPAFIRDDGTEMPLAWYTPGQFIFHVHKMKPGIPSTCGFLRALVWLYYFKHYGQQHKAKFLEKFGCPFLVAKISEADFNDDDKRSSIKNELRDIGNSGSGVVTDGSELTMTEAKANNAKAFLEWFQYIDDAYARLILGQSATKNDASGLSKGQAQENVRQDIKEADCRALMSTINKQLVRPYENFKYNRQGELFFKMDYQPPEDLTEKATTIETLSKAGWKTKKEYIEKTFNIPIDDEEVSGKDYSELKAVLDAYGVAVRAGTITPQKSDEELFRGILKLPGMDKDALDSWNQDGGVRRPITLKSKDQIEAEEELTKQKVNKNNPSNSKPEGVQGLSAVTPENNPVYPPVMSLASSGSDFAIKEEYIKRLTHNTLNKLFLSSEAMAEFYDPLRNEIKKVFSGVDPDDPNIVEIFKDKISKLFEKYDTLYDAMDTENFEKNIQGAILSAMVQGFTN